MRTAPFVLSFLALGACGTDGEGTVTVTAYGESFIEDGIPASEVGDGWAVEFSRFEVRIEQVTVAGIEVNVPVTVDLSEASAGEGHELGSVLVPSGDHTDAGFTVSRIEVDGTATKGADTKSFSWVFDQPSTYTECETTTSVRDGDQATFQITIHADHLLYDSLVSDEPQVLFRALADADLNEDGSITQPELAATDIGAYDPGSSDGVDDLWAWLVAQTQTLGHVDGEAHCRAAPAK
ncbi:MAG: hypothetical protein AAF355_11715 [Myxococcota bacterium]